MKASDITTGLLAAFLLGNVTVKNVPASHNSDTNQKTSISQLVEIASDNLTAKVALADNKNHDKCEGYADAMAFWRDGDTYNAMDCMEWVLDNNPLNMKYAKTLVGFYKETELYGEMADFFVPFIEANKELLSEKKNSKIAKFYAKSCYDAGIDSIYRETPLLAKANNRETMPQDYDSGVKLLESAVQLEPNNAEYHYELGWGYSVLANSYEKDSNEPRMNIAKGVNEHVKSIIFGGAKFVKSKRERKFIETMFSLAIPLYEKASELDPEFSYWTEELNEIKAFESTHFKEKPGK